MCVFDWKHEVVLWCGSKTEVSECVILMSPLCPMCPCSVFKIHDCSDANMCVYVFVYGVHLNQRAPTQSSKHSINTQFANLRNPTYVRQCVHSSDPSETIRIRNEANVCKEMRRLRVPLYLMFIYGQQTPITTDHKTCTVGVFLCFVARKRTRIICNRLPVPFRVVPHFSCYPFAVQNARNTCVNLLRHTFTFDTVESMYTVRARVGNIFRYKTQLPQRCKTARCSRNRLTPHRISGKPCRCDVAQHISRRKFRAPSSRYRQRVQVSRSSGDERTDVFTSKSISFGGILPS